MGIFDNLFGNFTGETGLQASRDMRTLLTGLLQQSEQSLQGGEAGGLASLRSGASRARGALTDNFGPAYQEPREYGQAGIDAIRRGEDDAWHAFDPLAAAGGEYGRQRDLAADMSTNALGLNGPGGIDAATAAFRAGPGYEFMLDQGLESIARNQNRAGMLASGNQMQESQRFGSGLADQEFDDWLNRLMGREQLYGPMEAGALGTVAGGRAGVTTGAAGRVADIYGQVGRGIGDLYSGQGQRLAGLEMGLGTAEEASQRQYRALMTQLVGQLATPTASTFQAGANAQNAAGANTQGLFTDVGRLIAGLF